jgi:hypothetical protein
MFPYYVDLLVVIFSVIKEQFVVSAPLPLGGGAGGGVLTHS